MIDRPILLGLILTMLIFVIIVVIVYFLVPLYNCVTTCSPYNMTYNVWEKMCYCKYAEKLIKPISWG